MYKAIRPARLSLSEDGIPTAEDYGDIYFNPQGQADEVRHVFIEGNDLSERWQGIDRFCIGETGFGSGLNLFTAWAAWQQYSTPRGRLHWVSVEKHPIRREDLQAIYQAWPEHKTLSDELLEQYPDAVGGFHRLTLAGGRLIVDLLIGDATEMLQAFHGRVDAWFLDGFAPAKNPDMWDEALFEQLARLSHSETTLATFTAAGHVRRALQAAGFEISKRPGFGRKREMLCGSYRQASSQTSSAPWLHLPTPPKDAQRAIVIGAGLAGTACAEALARRGWQVDVLEQHDKIAQEASGNPAGILLPRLRADHDPGSRFYLAGYQHALREPSRLARGGQTVPHAFNGVLELNGLPRIAQYQEKIQSHLPLPESFFKAVDQQQASELAGIPVGNGGLFYSQGGWLAPAALCEARLACHEQRIRLHTGNRVERICHDNDIWQVHDAAGRLLAEAPVLILANARQAKQLPGLDWLAINQVRGQLSYIKAGKASRGLQRVVCQEGYITPARDSRHVVGASYNRDRNDTELSRQEHEDNRRRLADILPDCMDELDFQNAEGRVAFRAVPPDRLPLVGPLIDQDDFQQRYADLHQGKPASAYAPARYLPGVYASLGHSSRGLITTALSAEIIAAMLCDEPLPVEHAVMEALLPQRFLLRSLRKRKT